MAEHNWEELYQSGETFWDKGEPSPGLVDFLDAHPDLTRGRVLVPGCGTGHDARAWNQAGYQVVGYDIAPSAVRLARQRTQSSGLTAAFEEGDFLTDTPWFPFDWIFEHTLFCAIQPARREDYVQAILRWLKPGGFFLAVHYMIPDEDGPPFGTNRQEVWDRFCPHLTLLKEWIPRSYPNRTGLERIFWWQRPG